MKALDVQILGTSFRFYTNAGVFSKNALDFGSRVLIENIVMDKQTKTLIDMGCGYGPIGIVLSKLYDVNVLMVDVNERALEMANKNILLNQANKCTTRHSDLFDQVNEKVDCIVTNPPIRTGKQNIFLLYKNAHDHLRDDGILYVVIQKKQGAPSTIKYLELIYKQVSVIAKEKGYWVLLAKKWKSRLTIYLNCDNIF